MAAMSLPEPACHFPWPKLLLIRMVMSYKEAMLRIIAISLDLVICMILGLEG